MPYIDTVRVVHYNLKVPYICTQYVSFTTSQDEGLGLKVASDQVFCEKGVLGD